MDKFMEKNRPRFEEPINPQEKREGGLEVVTVSRIENRHGIPIPNNDFDKLAKVLETYACGVGEASNATRNDYLRNTAGFGAVVDYLHNPNYAGVSPKGAKQEESYSTNPFIERIVKAAKEAHRDPKRDRWFIHYDYDGWGRFLKTSVSVGFDRRNNTLILGLYAAYVGDKVEKELAAALGVERAISSMGVKLELPEMSDQDLSVPLDKRPTFRLNCAPIAEVINAVVEKFGDRGDRKVQFKPEDLVNAFMRKSKYNDDEGSFAVSLGDGMRLSLGIAGGDRFVFHPGESGWENLVDTRKAEGPVLVLPFPVRLETNRPVTDYGDPPRQIRNYTLTFNVGGELDERGSVLPLHTREQLDRANAVVKFIQEQFQK
jgi:hypothetical protein